MNVNFPTPPAAAPRAEQLPSPAASHRQSRTTETFSFEKTLTRSQRELRSRADSRHEARDASSPEKPAPARGEKADRGEKAGNVERPEKAGESGDSGAEVVVEEVAAEVTTEVPDDVADVAAEVVVTGHAVAAEQVTEALPAVPDDAEAAAEVSGEAVTAEAMAAMAAVSAVEQAAGNMTTADADAVANQPAAPVAVKAALPKAVDAPVRATAREMARPVEAAEAPAWSESLSHLKSEQAAIGVNQQGAGESDTGQPQTSTKPHAVTAEITPTSGGASASSASSALDSALSTAAPPAPPPVNQQGGQNAVSALLAQQTRTDESSLRDEANVGKVMRGIGTAVNQRGGSVTLRLTPPELGAVRIDMNIRDGVVSAKFTAQTESVRHLLTDQMGHLKQALDRQGLVVEKIEVQSLPQQSASGGFDRQMDDAGREGRSAGQYTPQRRDGGGSSGQPRSPRQRGDGEVVDTFDRALVDAAQ